MELTTFKIPSFRRATVKARLDKLIKKAAKYGNGDITYSFGAETIEKVKTEDGDRQYSFVEITVSGEAPRVAGWDFLARVELLDAENLIHRVPGSTEFRDLSEYRHHNGHCDHCNSLRRRNDVYILSNGEEQIAVGRTCLRDFLGIDDPKAIVNRAQFFEELRSFEEDEFYSDGVRVAFDLHEILETAAAFIRRDGFRSKAKAMNEGFTSTGDCVMFCITGSHKFQIEVTDEDKSWKDKTIEYFRGADPFGNEYKDNIRVLMNHDMIQEKHLALIASAVITVQRDFEKQDEGRHSEFVGEVKERLKGLEVTLDKIIFLGHGMYGPTYLHNMKDEFGNVFSWFTGNKIELAEGSKIVLDGSIKEHKLYKGIKQTVLTRCKVK